ncbi:hypothetical protein FHG87_020569, partial [Trinorchestia longiramus]
TGETSTKVETKETNHSHGKKRKYNETYLQYGFTFIEINNEQRPMCVIYSEHLASESMKPAKLKRHLDTNHPSCASKPVVFYLIAKAKKPFTIGEELALPIAIRMTEIINGQKSVNELRKIPVADATVSRRILKISEEQFKQLLGRIKDNSKFAIQLDRTTDITNMAQLLAYVRYCHNDDVHEDTL